MPVTIVMTLPVDPGRIDEFFQLLRELAPGTQEHGGCLGYDIYSDKNNPGNAVFVETWKSMAAYEAYNTWRTENGVMDRLGAYFTGAPTIVFCDAQDSWRQAH
jgi:quinol monooxygenase YgiN